MRALKPVALACAGIFALAVGVIFVAVQVLWTRTYVAPLPGIAASTDPKIIARGKYLAEGPAHCFGCHVDEPNDRELREGKLFPPSGGRPFHLPIGTLYTANITPDRETGLGRFDDATVARALRHGVRHDGRMVFPLMPFQNLSDDDLQAVISFLRSQPSVKNVVPEHAYNFLGKALLAFVMEPVGPNAPPPKSVVAGPTIEYGKYLAHSVANCVGCHTNRDLRSGAFVGPPFAGGFESPSTEDPGKVIVTPNITPDPKTGRLAALTEKLFVDRFKIAGAGPRAVPGSIMPWESYRRMEEDDLRAVYRYLNSLPPVENNTEPTVRGKKA